MQQLRTRAVGAPAIKSLNIEAREATFVASTPAVDSYGEVVEQSWRLERFKANPVVLFGHKSRDLPIGSATRVAVVAGNLEVTIRFATAAANPLGEQVFQGVREGTIRAVSVGFVPGSVRTETRNGEALTILSDNELMEVSIVPIPANPEALAKAAGINAPHRDTRTADQQLADELLEELEGKSHGGVLLEAATPAYPAARTADPAGLELVNSILDELDAERDAGITSDDLGI